MYHDNEWVLIVRVSVRTVLCNPCNIVRIRPANVRLNNTPTGLVHHPASYRSIFKIQTSSDARTIYHYAKNNDVNHPVTWRCLKSPVFSRSLKSYAIIFVIIALRGNRFGGAFIYTINRILFNRRSLLNYPQVYYLPERSICFL